MKYFTEILFCCMWFVLWGENVCVADNTTIATTHDPFLLEFWLTKEPKLVKLTQNKSIIVVNDDYLYIKCTSTNVHVWEGIAHYQKFIHEMRPIQRNSTGYFTSFVNIKVQSFPNLSHPLICKELGEKSSRAKCIRLDYKGESSSENSVKSGSQTLSVTVDACPQIPMENDKDYESPTTPPPLSALGLYTPDFQLVDGFIAPLYAWASKSLIIQSPEAFMMTKDGKDVKLDVEILPEPRNQTTFEYYKFKMVANLSLDIMAIKLVGHRYDAWEPCTLKKDINVTVGLSPKIDGLPSKLSLFEDVVKEFIPFNVSGNPSPKLRLYFNGEEIKQNDRCFDIHRMSADQYVLHIRKLTERVAGTLRITAHNLVGSAEKFIIFEANWQWTKSESVLMSVGGAVTVLVLYLVAIFRLRPRETAETEPTTDSE